MSIDEKSLILRSFGSSLENVTCLTLGQILAHPLDLAMLFSHFPGLSDLSFFDIYSHSMHDDTGDVRRGLHTDIVPTHPCGTFSVSVPSEYRVSKGVFEAVVLLKPRVRQVSLMDINYGAWREYWPLVEACAGLLEELYILAHATGE